MNPLRLDPTRTSGLRRRFKAAMKARFELFKKELHKLLITGDALGLKSPKPAMTFNDEEWKFLSDDRKLEMLRSWLRFKVGQLFLKQEQENSTEAWLSQYIKQAYSQGLKRSWDDWKRPTGPLMIFHSI